MKRLSLVSALVVLVVWALGATVAMATPGSGVVGTPIARATFANAINTSQAAGLQSVIQQLSIAPGGHTGWHTHPGGTLILVQAGTFTIYDSTCTKAVTAENGGTLEHGGHVQLARNEGTLPLLLTVVYFDVPVGGAVRADATTPTCAVGADANNLPEGPAGSGISFNVPGGIVQRSTHTAAANITAAAGTDVVIQKLTFDPGAFSGWHSHPGQTVVHVESGTDSFYMADCMKHNVTAGQAAVEAAGLAHVARNEGSVPLVLRAVYFNVPVGASQRIDQPEPSTCRGLVGGSAATPAPAPVAAAPRSLPATSTEPSDLTNSAMVAVLVALASVAGLAMVGRARRRSRTI